MAASKEFMKAIQERLGDGATEAQAQAACEWLDARRNIEPYWGAGDVGYYLRSLGVAEGDEDTDPKSQEACNWSDAIWAECVSAVEQF